MQIIRSLFANSYTHCKQLSSKICSNIKHSQPFSALQNITPIGMTQVRKDDQVSSVDTVFDDIGGCGRFQWLVGGLMQLSTLLWVGTGTFFSFGMLDPNYVCHDYPQINYTDQCNLLANCTNFTSTSDFYSFVEEFNLSCGDRAYLPTLVLSISNALIIPTNLISSWGSDRYWGRKPSFVVSMFGMTIAYIAASFAPNFYVVMGATITAGIFMGISWSTGTIYPLEMVTKDNRIFMSCAWQYSLMYMVSALLAYITKNWRHYTLVYCLISFPAVIGWFLFIGESPRWLIQRGRYKDALKSLKNIARINGKSVRTMDIAWMQPLHDTTVNGQIQHGSTSVNVIDIFRNRYLTTVTMIQCLTNFNVSAISSIVLYGSGSLAGSPYINIGLYGLLRIWVPPTLIIVDKKSISFGRKRVLSGCLVVLLICLIVNAGVILSDNQYSLGILVMICAQIAVAINASAFSVVNRTVTSELFPTVLRNIGQAVTDVAGVAGMVAGPQIIYLNKLWPAAAYVIFGVTCLLDLMVIVFLLPETKGTKLPENMSDIKKTSDVQDELFELGQFLS